MIRLQDNPARLSAGLARPSEAVGTWWVAHTKPRTEKALAFELARLGVDYFLPLAKRTRVTGGRRRATMLPLFPSYLFFAGDAAERVKALSTDRVVNTLKVNDQGGLADELDALHAALTVREDLDVYPHVAVGRRCRVSRGALRGVEGIVVSDGNVTRIVLSVSVLGQGASLEIPADFLEAAN